MNDDFDPEQLPPEKLAELRRPFDPSQVGKKPQPYKKDSEPGDCNVCGKWHKLPAAHVDYAGHAAVTDRLLQVDPYWNWEPVAWDADGLPRYSVDSKGMASMWIKLTICGFTRLGVGTVEPGKAEFLKQLIGDAIRNASMRFGVGLDLWSKEDLTDSGEDTQHDGHVQQQTQQRQQSQGQQQSRGQSRQGQRQQPQQSTEDAMGWESVQRGREFHDELNSRIQSAPEPVKEAIGKYRRDQQIPWPCTPEQWAQLDREFRRLLEVHKAGGDLSVVPADGRAVAHTRATESQDPVTETPDLPPEGANTVSMPMDGDPGPTEPTDDTEQPADDPSGADQGPSGTDAPEDPPTDAQATAAVDSVASAFPGSEVTQMATADQQQTLADYVDRIQDDQASKRSWKKYRENKKYPDDYARMTGAQITEALDFLESL